MAVHRPCNRLVAAKARIERRMIERALRMSAGDVGAAARLLGCNRAGLYRLIRQYAVPVSVRPTNRGTAEWQSMGH